ncbi:MAG: 4Fe-4S dicluster domain-containing protein, partial [Gemmatimonadota bacterium]
MGDRWLEDLLACVHCGFCNATCPTYQELGDERDGPRGRIYLVKQMLETGPVRDGGDAGPDAVAVGRGA